eukprot:COSAG03_NODE_2597_length_2608_cov_3.880829_2_plen_295_part_00
MTCVCLSVCVSVSVSVSVSVCVCVSVYVSIHIPCVLYCTEKVMGRLRTQLVSAGEAMTRVHTGNLSLSLSLSVSLSLSLSLSLSVCLSLCLSLSLSLSLSRARARSSARSLLFLRRTSLTEYASASLVLSGNDMELEDLQVRHYLSCRCVCLCASVPLCLCASVPLCLCASVCLCMSLSVSLRICVPLPIVLPYTPITPSAAQERQKAFEGADTERLRLSGDRTTAMMHFEAVHDAGASLSLSLTLSLSLSLSLSVFLCDCFWCSRGPVGARVAAATRHRHSQVREGGRGGGVS